MIVNRRRLLQTIGVFLLGGVSGCLGNGDEPGRLVVRNDHSLGHTITVRIEDGPTTAPEVENETAAEIFVDASEERQYDGVFSNPGQYASLPDSMPETKEPQRHSNRSVSRVATTASN